jgi:hypothetical protein
MSFSIAFIITPYIGTLIADKLGFNILWIGTGVLAAIAAALYFLFHGCLRIKSKREIGFKMASLFTGYKKPI